jgi:hypothetical protein
VLTEIARRPGWLECRVRWRVVVVDVPRSYRGIVGNDKESGFLLEFSSSEG